MRKIIFFICIFTTIITSPCMSQQNNSIDVNCRIEINELNYYKNIFFSWQYYYYFNNNLSIFDLTPLFFDNLFYKINTFDNIFLNYSDRRTNIVNKNIISNENNVSNFIAEVGLLSMFFIPNSIMNNYQKDIYRNYRQEQHVNDRIFK